MFEAFVKQLASDLVEQVTGEHAREITAMFHEIVRLREQLTRASNLMEAYVMRERELHEMLDGLTDAYSQGTAKMHESHEQFMQKTHAETVMKVDRLRKMKDPMRDAQAELDRIRQVVNANPTTPYEVRQMQAMQAKGMQWAPVPGAPGSPVPSACSGFAPMGTWQPVPGGPPGSPGTMVYQGMRGSGMSPASCAATAGRGMPLMFPYGGQTPPRPMMGPPSACGPHMAGPGAVPIASRMMGPGAPHVQV